MNQKKETWYYGCVHEISKKFERLDPIELSVKLDSIN